MCCQCIQLELSSLLPSFMLTLQSSSSPSHLFSQKYTLTWTFNHHEMFECAHLKFTVSGLSKQTNIQACPVQSRQCGACSGLPIGSCLLVRLAVDTAAGFKSSCFSVKQMSYRRRSVGREETSKLHEMTKSKILEC